MLFARNVTFAVRDDKIDDFKGTFAVEVLPVLNAQPGFKSGLVLLNKAQAMSISVWEDRLSAENYETTAYGKVLDTLMPFLAASPTIERYDVGWQPTESR